MLDITRCVRLLEHSLCSVASMKFLFGDVPFGLK